LGDASRRMEQTRLRTPAALSHPSLYQNIVPRQSEGAGNAGRSDRTRSFVCRKTHVVTTGEPRNTAFPARMVLTVSFVLSPEIGLVVSVTCEINSRKLDASVETSGPHDFAVRFAPAFVVRKPRRPPLPAPNVRDDRETPLLGGRGMAGILRLICTTAQCAPLRPIGTTGKSGAAAEMLSSDEQLLEPGRVPDAAAAWSAAPQSRDP